MGHNLSALMGLSALTITFLTNRGHPHKADVASKVIGDFSENRAAYAKAFPRFLDALNRPQQTSKTGQHTAAKRVATVSVLLTVGFFPATYRSGDRTSWIWMRHAATGALPKAKLS